MSRILMTSLVLLAALAGCEQQPEAAAPAPTRIEVANPYHERLQALSERDRSLTLRRAVQDSGQSCRRIDGSAYRTEYEGLQMWTARCDGTRDYAVFIGANGDVQVRNCSEAKTLGLPECGLPVGRP